MGMLLEVSGLTKKYNAAAGIENLQFCIAPGQILAYLGHNGAGKTTTIRTLLGLLKRDAGVIKYFGREYDTGSGDFDNLRRKLGVCLDNPGFYPNLSAIDNLAFFGSLYGVRGKEFSARAEELLGVLGLSAVRNQKVKAFSKGMRQKLALARALLHRPKLVFLDEPMSGLDPAARVLMRDLLLHLARNNGVAFFLTSHELGEVELLADNVIILEKGRIKLAGSLAELRRTGSDFRYKVVLSSLPANFSLESVCARLACRLDHMGATTFLLSANVKLGLGAVSEAFSSAGATVDEFSSETKNLEQIYFESLSINDNAN